VRGESEQGGESKVSWLLVTTAWPWPVRRGLQARTLELAAILAERGEGTVLAPAPRGGASAERAAPGNLPYRVETFRPPFAGVPASLVRAALTGRSGQSGLFTGRDLERRFRALGRDADRVVLQTARLGGLHPLPERDRLVIDLIDSLSLNFEARARLDRPWRRPLWAFEARQLRRDERRLVAAARSALVVSERDRAHLAGVLGEALAARVAVVPLALADRPAARPKARPRGAGPHLLVTGNLAYFPTRHGLGWFLREVWPRIREVHAGARLVVAGSRPPAKLADGLVAVGAELVREPEEFTPLLAEADVALAPLFAGSGTPMKLLEAVAAGVPVLATPFAAAGLEPAIAAEVEVASEAAGWIDALRRAAAERDPWERRAQTARRVALEIHSPAAVSERFWRTVVR
jgi:glycosyltransferase involved in cell wall biosynthesis